jgi:hypothetical protein
MPNFLVFAQQIAGQRCPAASRQDFEASDIFTTPQKTASRDHPGWREN